MIYELLSKVYKILNNYNSSINRAPKKELFSS